MTCPEQLPAVHQLHIYQRSVATALFLHRAKTVDELWPLDSTRCLFAPSPLCHGSGADRFHSSQCVCFSVARWKMRHRIWTASYFTKNYPTCEKNEKGLKNYTMVKLCPVCYINVPAQSFCTLNETATHNTTASCYTLTPSVTLQNKSTISTQHDSVLP